MTITAGYSVGVHLLSISKVLASSLSSYDYFSTAVMQAFQMHITTKTAAKALRAYNISTGQSPWYIRALNIVALPCSVCFEINRWSSDYQPVFWKKKTVLWVCDHIEMCTYSIFIVASVALAAVGQPGILLGTITTFSIDQIHNYSILPTYYCHALTTVNMLASAYFSRGISSFLMSATFLITELIDNTYFFVQPVQQRIPINNAFVAGKTIDNVKNNPLHIHYKIELDSGVKEILTIFDEITWDPNQCKELLLQDHFWIKRADIHNTDPVSYILSFRSDIKKFIDELEICPHEKKKKSTELCLKVFIKYLKVDSQEPLQSEKLILRFVSELRASQQKGISYLEKTAEEYYEKIKTLPLEQKVLQVLYKKRKEIFNQLVDKLFAEDQILYAVADPIFINFFRPYIQAAFNSHMGISLFPKNEHSALLKASVQAAYADANIPTEQYFCDRETSEFYTPQVIIDVLIDALDVDIKGNQKALCNALTQWYQEQGIKVDLKNKVMQIQTAKQHLQSLAARSGEYYEFNILRHISDSQLDLSYRHMKEDCRTHFQALKETVKVEGNSEEFANTILLGVREGLFAYSEVEKCLNSLLLKMGIFQLNL